MADEEAQVPNCPVCGAVGEHGLRLLGGCFVENILQCPQGHHWRPRTGEIVRPTRQREPMPSLEELSDWARAEGMFDRIRQGGSDAHDPTD